MEENMERLSVCEEEVYLEICWMSEPPALEDVRSAVNRLGHEWKPQTVSTFLNRLVKKRYLSMWKKGRYYYYKPEIYLEDYQAAECTRMLNRIFKGDSQRMQSCRIAPTNKNGKNG